MDLERLKTIRLLYIEDDPDVRKNVVENLSPFLHTIHTAADGKEGMELFLKEKEWIDIVVTDIMMPHMDGIETAKAIRRYDAEIPIIYTTAFDESSLILETVRLHAAGYILKPIDVEELLTLLGRAYAVVENRRLHEELLRLNHQLETKIWEKEKELQKRLYHDDLTELPNRLSLNRAIERMEYPLVAILDIDSFRTINDLYGIEVGNAVLKEFSRLLKKYEKELDGTFFRTGSDDFVLLVEAGRCSENRLRKRIESFVTRINETSIQLKEKSLEVMISVTAGIACGRKNLLEKADMALRNASEEHLPYLYFDEYQATHEEYEQHISTVHLIKRSIEEESILPFFQPIVDKERRICHHEALMRIKQGKTLHLPGEFLDVAKKSKLYIRLSEIMIEKSFAAIEAKRASVTINLSYYDIAQKSLRKRLVEMLESYKIGTYVTFEITEDESVKDYRNILRFIEEVRPYGAKIAIDDFGSGYSNFVYLLDMRPDLIKIDGSIVRKLDTDAGAVAITRTIVGFSHELGIRTVAEFIASETLFTVAKALNVDFFQGFHFGKAEEWTL